MSPGGRLGGFEWDNKINGANFYNSGL